MGRTNQRRFSLEQLEARQMLAAFIVNEPLRNVELQRSGNNIQVVNAANNADVILSVAADAIDNDQITITAASLIVDSVVNLDGNSLMAQADRIELSSVTITTADLAPGGDAENVILKTDGISSTRWDDVGAFKDNVGTQLTDQLQAIPLIGLSMSSPISGQVKVHLSTAEIGLLNSTIDSSSSVTIGATAAADASINAVAINGMRTGVNNNSVDKGQEKTGSKASTRETVDLASSTAVMYIDPDV